MRKALLALSLVSLLIPASALAAARTVIFSVPGMFCEACPFIVEQSISRVDGVHEVEASLRDRTATVTFDDAITGVEAIARAALDVGYEVFPVPEAN